jgi:hypothetical protein
MGCLPFQDSLVKRHQQHSNLLRKLHVIWFWPLSHVKGPFFLRGNVNPNSFDPSVVERRFTSASELQANNCMAVVVLPLLSTRIGVTSTAADAISRLQSSGINLT